jgi:predicted regulator of Ras-like GTPase activity (Roadblock/LC7/MglB family)
MLACMDAAHAIADLTEISPQVRRVAVVAADGTLAGTNVADEAVATRLADGAKRLVDAAEELRPGVSQLEAATVEGSVFVVRDGERTIVATTTPEPTVGLVFYDLKTCLRAIDAEPPPKPKRARKTKEDAGDAAA